MSRKRKTTSEDVPHIVKRVTTTTEYFLVTAAHSEDDALKQLANEEQGVYPVKPPRLNETVRLNVTPLRGHSVPWVTTAIENLLKYGSVEGEVPVEDLGRETPDVDDDSEET